MESLFENNMGYSVDYHRLQAIKAWIKCGNVDSALVHMAYMIYTYNYTDYKELAKLFEKLVSKKNTEYNKLIKISKCYYDLQKKSYKPHLAKILDSLYIEDQFDRTLGNVATDVSIMKQKLHIGVIDSLYKIYGWLSIYEVGIKAAQTQFLAIQHSDLKPKLSGNL